VWSAIIVETASVGKPVGFTASSSLCEQRIWSPLLQLLYLRGSNGHGAHWKTQKHGLRIVSPIINMGRYHIGLAQAKTP
jgi:hypothetical protein